MSNCVNIYTDTVLDPKVFDCSLLMKNVQSAGQMRTCPKDFEGSVMWWFLFGAVKIDAGDTIIEWGSGRSTHTWRDLRHVATVLSRYVYPKVEGFVYLPMRMSDESDGFTSAYDFHLEVK